LPARLPAAEAWLAALTGLDGRLDADPAELSAFAQALAPWEDVGTGQTGPARATFRLAEIPAEPDGVPFGAGAGDEPRQPAAAASGERAGDEQGGAADGTPDGSWGGRRGARGASACGCRSV